MNVLITGSHGLIGTALYEFFTGQGHTVFRMMRGSREEASFFWDAASGELRYDETVDIHAVINFMGEPIASGRWTKRKKQRILESRTFSTGKYGTQN